jgi:hypothetical protein
VERGIRILAFVRDMSGGEGEKLTIGKVTCIILETGRFGRFVQSDLQTAICNMAREGKSDNTALKVSVREACRILEMGLRIDQATNERSGAHIRSFHVEIPQICLS